MPFANSADKYRSTKADASGKPIPGYVDPNALTEEALSRASLNNPQVAGLVGLQKAVVKGVTKIPGGTTALEMISDAIDYTEGGLAGAMGYAKEHTSLSQPVGDAFSGLFKAAKSGADRRASYQEVFGPSGVYLDIFGPATALVGEGAGGLMRAAGLPALKAGLNAAGKAVPEPAKAMFAQVNKPYAYSRMGIKEGLDIESELAGKMHQAQNMTKTNSEKEMLRLVPDPEGLKRLAMATEDGDMSNLAPNEMQALPFAQHLRDQIEKERVGGKVITQETVAGLKDKMNTEYFPHIILPPKERIVSLDKAIADKSAQGLDTSYLETLKSEAEYDAKSRIAKWADQAFGKGKKPGFAKERTGTTTIRNMGDIVNIMNTNAAEALGIARQQTARAIATRDYLMDYIDMLKRRNIPINQEAPGYTHLKPQFPGMPENIYIPDNIHKTIMGVSQRIANPEEGFLTGLGVLDMGNRLFRNWNLFLRPSTLLMNGVGNVFNNYARLEMGPESLVDYAHTAGFLAKKKAGRLDMGAQSFIKGLTNKQLSGLFERERITGTGWSHEAGYMSGAKKTATQQVKGIAGSESVLLEPGKKAFTAIEDWHRAAAFVNQLKKGLSPRQAARNVFDSMFDYELGLTGFEQDVMRRAVPFYSWTRFNLPLQLRMLVEHPERYVNMARAARGVEKTLGGPRPDESQWSDYERDGVPMRYSYDEATGEYKTIKLDNLVPAVQAFSLLKPEHAVKYIEGGLTPAIAAPAQLGTNRDWFKSTPERAVKIKGEEGEVKNVLGVNLPSKAAWAALQFPPVRIAQQARQALQKGKGAKGAVERVSLPYSATVNQDESEQYAQRRVAGKMKDLDASRKRWARQLNNPKATPDQKKEASANIKNIARLMNELSQQQK